MLRIHGLALRFSVLLSLFSTGCCCLQSPCHTGCGTGPIMSSHACSSGCGEFYVDEWYNHPPQVSSCDTCGNHVGSHGHDACGCGGASCAPLLHRLSCLWGIRYVPVDCEGGCEGGCDSCGGGVAIHEGHVGSSHSGCASCAAGAAHAHHGGHHEAGEVIYDGPVRGNGGALQPTPAPTPAKPSEVSPMPTPAPSTTTRNTSPALRKRSAIQPASAQQPLRRR